MAAPHCMDKQTYRPRFALFAGVASLGVVSVLIVVKAMAYWYSGSA
jgi:hypothetical protein